MHLKNSNQCISIGTKNTDAAMVFAGISGPSGSVGIYAQNGAQIDIGPNVWFTDLDTGIYLLNNSVVKG